MYSLGFGRRICLGRISADSSLFLTIAQGLAVFDISKAIDKQTGSEIVPVLATKPVLIAHPFPFKCRIVPRSEKHAKLIRKFEVEHPWEEGDAKLLKGPSS